MSHTFNILVTGDKSTILKHVGDSIRASGGTFVAETISTGKFSGSGVEGSYHIVGDVVVITISKKPFVVSNAYIEKRIREYFDKQ